MRAVLAHILSYCFIYITAIQLVINSIFLIDKEFYIKHAVIFSNFAGLNILYLIALSSAAFLLNYCKYSRICAVAQILMTIIWFIIQDDNIYNITIQLILGSLALMLTYINIKI